MSEALGALAERLLTHARDSGADQSEVWLQEATQLSATVRLGVVEELRQATSRALSLRVFLGQRVAHASASDLARETLDRLVRRAIERARLASEDPFAGLPEHSASFPSPETLALYDSEFERLGADEAIVRARETERIGLSLDTHVQNSSGASFCAVRSAVWGANSRGFCGYFRQSAASVQVTLLGQSSSDAAQVSDYWYSAARHLAQLESCEQVARRAVARVRRHFGARKLPTREVPVVFEPLTAAELLADLFGAVCGELVYLKRSFLAESCGQMVASEHVTLVDDGLLPGGLGTRPFDREGVAAQRTIVIEKGVLKNFLCSAYAARKLGLAATGNGTGNGEAPTNFYLLPDSTPPEEILRSAAQCLYVTRLLGQGVNLVTGDYSRGAFGLWVERGEIVHPVHEITISGNLRQMLAGVEQVGNDLDLRGQFGAPSVKLAAMTVAGI